ncbi:MAG TPA: plastocyanin/azurin family copper-binding protein [Candidatus Limnocylindria bacterium]|nr:plastocyanin/azurin family copper-binding protein [Candidatus Limnocylindria bacterium]
MSRQVPHLVFVFAAMLLAAPIAGAGQVRINASGMSFTPPTAPLNLGDHAVWVWTSGSHTVVSGTTGTTAGDGRFNSGGGTNGVIQARFSWKTNQLGSLPYYCTPHFADGMTGTLSVSGSGIAVSDFRVTEVQFNVPGGQDLIEIANVGDVTGNFGRYRLSVQAGFAVEIPLNDLPVVAGNRIVIHANASGTTTATDVFLPTLPDLPANGSVALYVPNTRNPDLTDETQIIDFVQWGAPGQAHETTAAAALFWNVGDAITGVEDGRSIEFCGDRGEYGAAFWSEVTTPNLGTSGNCATPTVHPTWGRLKKLYR